MKPLAGARGGRRRDPEFRLLLLRLDDVVGNLKTGICLARFDPDFAVVIAALRRDRQLGTAARRQLNGFLVDGQIASWAEKLGIDAIKEFFPATMIELFDGEKVGAAIRECVGDGSLVFRSEVGRGDLR